MREKDVLSGRGARLPVTQKESPVDRRLSLFTSNQETRNVWPPATAEADPYGAGIPSSGLAEPFASRIRRRLDGSSRAELVTCSVAFPRFICAGPSMTIR